MENLNKKKAFFRNTVINKNSLKNLMVWSFQNFGMAKSVFLSDSLKNLGFESATQAGISISIEDLKTPFLKNHLIQTAREKSRFSKIKCCRGEITEAERVEEFTFNWNAASEILKNEIVNYLKNFDPLNPIYLMAFSGARGNISQIRQLVGIRGLMVGPSGDIIDIPITKNFREGLSITDYMISAYGARKGVVDTALKTADSGYLTRRLVDVAQDVLVKENDCYSNQGIFLFDLNTGEGNSIKLKNRLLGRVLAKDILDQKLNLPIALKNQQINEILLKIFEENKIDKIFVRSPLTCELSRSVCKNCYGWNLSRGKLVDLGEAVGIIAAQSIGEPGTQLTMRTFHTGGIFSSESSLRVFSKTSGKIIFSNEIKVISQIDSEEKEFSILKTPGSIYLVDFNHNISTIFLKEETILFVKDNDYVIKNQIISSVAESFLSKTERKNVFSKVSGEIFLNLNKNNIPNIHFNKNKSELVSILFGTVINIPLYCKIKKYKFSNLKISTSLAHIKLINYKSGFLNISKSNNFNQSNFKNISIINKSFKIPNSKVYKFYSKKNKINFENKIIFSLLNTNKYYFIQKPVYTIQKNLIIANLINTNYKINAEGKLFYIRLKKNLSNKGSKKYKFNKIGSIFFLPQEKFIVLEKTLLLDIESKIWLKKNTNLTKNSLNKNSGFLNLTNNDSYILINFKFSCFIKLNINKINHKLDKKLLFPGEKIFNRFYIKKIVYIEVNKNVDNVFLIFRPGFLYEIKKTKIEKKFLIGQKNFNIRFEEFTVLNFKNFQKVKLKNKTAVDLIKTQLIFVNNEENLKENIYNINFQKEIDNFCLKFNIFENILNKKDVKKNLLESKLSLLIKNSQFLESNTIIANIDFFPKIKLNNIKIKEKKDYTDRKILIISNKNYKRLYTESKNLINFQNILIKTGDLISKNLILSNSGFIEKNSVNQIKLRLAKMILFSSGATIFFSTEDFIKKNQLLGILLYSRSKTGDIVKGLPKIEEILEGRKPKERIKSFINPFLFLDVNIKMDFKNSFLLEFWDIFLYADKYGLKICSEERCEKKFIIPGEFVIVGRALNCDMSNAHDEIKYLNRYYKQFLTQYQAAYRTLKKIQSYLINQIQIIYSSQNVIISDKHVEIIIKKMTSKVKIDENGDSGIGIGEYLDLRQVNNMNIILSKTNSNEIIYRPILFGITKASLITDSFISASSFQQTVRVLSYASIQGKVDWLKGLKENVIIGRLIPSGTGFNSYEHISHLNLRIPKKLIDKVS